MWRVLLLFVAGPVRRLAESRVFHAHDGLSGAVSNFVFKAYDAP